MDDFKITVTYPSDYTIKNESKPVIQYSYNKTGGGNDFPNKVDCVFSGQTQTCEQRVGKNLADLSLDRGYYQVFFIDDQINKLILPTDNPKFCASDCCLTTNTTKTIYVQEKQPFTFEFYGNCTSIVDLGLKVGSKSLSDCSILEAKTIQCTLNDASNIKNNTPITFMGCGERMDSGYQVLTDSGIYFDITYKLLLFFAILII